MLKVRGYDIYFKHKPDEWGYTTNTINGREVKTPYKGVTYCYVVEISGKEDTPATPISVGAAFCGAGDRFEKAVGRKISLGRAIANLGADFRKEIWELYLKTSK